MPTPPPTNPNADSITVESGGLKIRLPTLVLIHILSLLGVCGGTYQLAKPGVTSARTELQVMQSRMDQLEHTQVALLERLARIETNTENTRDALRELRQWTRATQTRN